MVTPAELRERVAALKKAGQYEQAADLYLQAGDPLQASQLFADVWQYESAIRIAEEARRFDIAYAHALAAGNQGEVRRILERLCSEPARAEAAAAVAEQKGRMSDAAMLSEAAGDVEAAARRFSEAGELCEAARCYEAMGDYRQAGVLFERRVREAPDDADAALQLGRILVQFGRYEPAVRALQKAADDPELGTTALKLLVSCFAALSMNDAAASCLDRLRQHDPELPLTVPDYLELVYGDPRGPGGLASREDQVQLLAGRYRIRRTLGAGATGRVLLAHDAFYDRDVAIKVLTVGSGASGRDAYVRFAREARVAAGMDHPNVVRVFEFNPDGPFLVMEYMEGGTLEDRLSAAAEGQPMGLRRVQHVIHSVLNGLEAVHRRGVVHRDLKPANIFFDRAGGVKLGDFGVAHLADLGATLTGAMLGTLAYMAPEQITGSELPGASTDLYAIGVILYRALTGRLPFPGPDFMAQHLHETPPPIGSLVPSLGDQFDAAVTKLLAKDPADRPHSAADARALIDALTWNVEDEAPMIATIAEVSEAAASDPPPSDDQRYRMEAGAVAEESLAIDSLLGRTVRVLSCDAARADWLRRWAAVDSPFVQAVYEIDVDAGRAILEHPSGVPWNQARLAPEVQSARRAELEYAAQCLRDAELWTASELPIEHTVVSETRTVVCVPLRARAET